MSLGSGLRPPALRPLWTRELPGSPLPDQVACPMDEEQAFVVALGCADPARPGTDLFGLDPATGALRWKIENRWTGPAAGVAVAVVPFRVAVLATGAKELEVFDRSRGTSLGSLPLPSRATGVGVLGIDHQDATLGGPGLVVEVRSARPYAEEMLPGEPGVLAEAAAIPPGLRVIGAGRSLAAFHAPGGRLGVISIPTGRELWSTSLDEPVEVALVRMRYLLVGGRTLTVLDINQGTVLDVLDLGGPTRRIEERANLLYHLDRNGRFSLMDLDTRKPVHQLEDVAAFDPASGADLFLDRSAGLHVMRGGTPRETASWLLAPQRPESSQGRMQVRGTRIFLMQGDRAGTTTTVQCFDPGEADPAPESSPLPRATFPGARPPRR